MSKKSRARRRTRRHFPSTTLILQKGIGLTEIIYRGWPLQFLVKQAGPVVHQHGNYVLFENGQIGNKCGEGLWGFYGTNRRNRFERLKKYSTEAEA